MYTGIFVLIQFHLFCEHPSSGSLSKKTLEVHKNQTLGEATERAYKVNSTSDLWSHIFPQYVYSPAHSNDKIYL